MMRICLLIFEWRLNVIKADASVTIGLISFGTWWQQVVKALVGFSSTVSLQSVFFNGVQQPLTQVIGVFDDACVVLLLYPIKP